MIVICFLFHFHSYMCFKAVAQHYCVACNTGAAGTISDALTSPSQSIAMAISQNEGELMCLELQLRKTVHLFILPLLSSELSLGWPTDRMLLMYKREHLTPGDDWEIKLYWEPEMWMRALNTQEEIRAVDEDAYSNSSIDGKTEHTPLPVHAESLREGNK